MKDYKQFMNEKFSAPRFWVKNNHGTFAVIDRDNKDKMVVGYSKKDQAEKTAKGLLATDEKDLDDVIKKLKSKEGYGMFVNEGGVFMGGKSYSANMDILAAYNDLSPEERKTLDDYCESKFGKQFLNCSWEEQSTARGTTWTEENDPEEIEKQNQKDAKL